MIHTCGINCVSCNEWPQTVISVLFIDITRPLSGPRQLYSSAPGWPLVVYFYYVSPVADHYASLTPDAFRYGHSCFRRMPDAIHDELVEVVSAKFSTGQLHEADIDALTRRISN